MNKMHVFSTIVLALMLFCLASAKSEKENKVETEGKTETEHKETLEYAKGSVCGYCEHCKVHALSLTT